MTGRKASTDTKEKMSISAKNSFNSGRFKPGISYSKETEFKCGEEHPDYIDGRTELVQLIRTCNKYNQWRNKIFKKDKYVCRTCNKYGQILHAHHYITFSNIFNLFLKTYNNLNPIEDKYELLGLSKKYDIFWDIDNGITLCKDCHIIGHNCGEL